VFEDTSQVITVNTNPLGASCVFYRQNLAIGTIVSTPGFLSVTKANDDITIRCNKPGYTEVVYLDHSHRTNLIAGTIAADAGLSYIVDSVAGADSKYYAVVNLSLPVAEPASFPAANAQPRPLTH
jgi:hypothetical protein